MQMASTFEVSLPIKLVSDGNQDLLVAGDAQAEKDGLEGVPLI